MILHLIYFRISAFLKVGPTLDLLSFEIVPHWERYIQHFWQSRPYHEANLGSLFRRRCYGMRNRQSCDWYAASLPLLCKPPALQGSEECHTMASAKIRSSCLSGLLLYIKWEVGGWGRSSLSCLSLWSAYIRSWSGPVVWNYFLSGLVLLRLVIISIIFSPFIRHNQATLPESWSEC